MNISAREGFNKQTIVILKGMDHLLLFCFGMLVFTLPMAHTESIRAFSLAIPAALWILKMVLERRWIWVRTPLDLPLAAFTLVAALSLLGAVDFDYSLNEYVGEWLLGVYLFYLAVNHFRREQLKWILIALLCGNLLMVGYGGYEFFNRGGSLFDYQIRSQSFHNGYGAFSTYLVTVLPYILLGFFASAKDHSLRRFLLLLLLGNLFVLYLTQARGAWVAAVLLLLWAGGMYLSKKTLLLLGAIGVLLAFTILPKQILQHHAPLLRPDAPGTQIETGQARWELLKFSVERVRENPFQMLGFGQRSFVKKYPEFYNQYKGARLWHAHSTFLNIAFQTGLQGLALFIYLIYGLLKFTYNKARGENSPLHKFYFQATFMMIVIFLVRNLTDDFFKDDAALLFWFLAGAAVAIKEG